MEAALATTDISGRKGKLFMAADTLGHHRTLTRPMELHFTPANEQERALVETSAKEFRRSRGKQVKLMYRGSGAALETSQRRLW